MGASGHIHVDTGSPRAPWWKRRPGSWKEGGSTVSSHTDTVDISSLFSPRSCVLGLLENIGNWLWAKLECVWMPILSARSSLWGLAYLFLGPAGPSVHLAGSTEVSGSIIGIHYPGSPHWVPNPWRNTLVERRGRWAGSPFPQGTTTAMKAAILEFAALLKTKKWTWLFLPCPWSVFGFGLEIYGNNQWPNNSEHCSDLRLVVGISEISLGQVKISLAAGL